MPPLPDWQTLFAVQAGAAATLTGLVFVAVSINLDKIIAAPSLPGRAVDSLSQFLQVFFVCTAALIPHQPVSALAVEILVIAVPAWALQIYGHVSYARSRTGHPWMWLLSRIAQTQFASIPFFLAGFFLLRGSGSGLYWLVLGFALSFIAGVTNAWILLVEIAR